MIVGLAFALLVTLAYAIWTDYRLYCVLGEVCKLRQEAAKLLAPIPFQVGDRLDVDVDDAPLLTDTGIRKLVERAKDTSRWAR